MSMPSLHRLYKTRQESDRSRRQPEGSFFYSFYRNLRHQPQLTAGVGATTLPWFAICGETLSGLSAEKKDDIVFILHFFLFQKEHLGLSFLLLSSNLFASDDFTPYHFPGNKTTSTAIEKTTPPLPTQKIRKKEKQTN